MINIIFGLITGIIVIVFILIVWLVSIYQMILSYATGSVIIETKKGKYARFCNSLKRYVIEEE
jgi:hypothetical protein